jgi:hypothetical protein
MLGGDDIGRGCAEILPTFAVGVWFFLVYGRCCECIRIYRARSALESVGLGFFVVVVIFAVKFIDRCLR